MPKPRTSKDIKATTDRYNKRHPGKKKTVTFGPNTVITITLTKNNKGTHNENNHNNSDDQQELTIGRIKPTKEEQQEENYNNTKAKSNNRRKWIRKNKNLTIVTCNVNGIKGKINSLESMLQATKAHIALITDTKLPEKQKINIKGYKWKRKKTEKNRTGGGVGILVAHEIAKHDIEDNINDDIEGVETQWLQLECRPQNVSIGVFYGPQENEIIEKVKEIYETLDHQINQRKKQPKWF